MRNVWRRLRIIWATLGVSATVVLIVWSAVAYRADAFAQAALVSNESVVVSEFDDHWLFRGRAAEASNAGLLFFPGALVDPSAYAPLARAAADAGYLSILVRVPRRGVLGGAELSGLIPRALARLREFPEVTRWLVAGHSRGAEIAARFARDHPAALGALLLIATSHPRDFSLANALYKVTHVSASLDGYATTERVAANRRNLPEGARLIVIEGGNHCQFAWYGFQPGDRFATIPRAEQQKRTTETLLAALGELDAPSAAKPR